MVVLVLWKWLLLWDNVLWFLFMLEMLDNFWWFWVKSFFLVVIVRYFFEKKCFIGLELDFWLGNFLVLFLEFIFIKDILWKLIVNLFFFFDIVLKLFWFVGNLLDVLWNLFFEYRFVFDIFWSFLLEFLMWYKIILYIIRKNIFSIEFFVMMKNINIEWFSWMLGVFVYRYSLVLIFLFWFIGICILVVL